MDVVDVDATRSYIAEQIHIEDNNGLVSSEYFADDADHPSKVVLLASDASDASHLAHHENIRIELLLVAFTHLTLQIFGNPPQAVKDRMGVSGYPAEQNMQYLMGFHRAV